MPGGLFQLLAYGAQDVYLMGEPNITSKTVSKYCEEKVVVQKTIQTRTVYKIVYTKGKEFELDYDLDEKEWIIRI